MSKPKKTPQRLDRDWLTVQQTADYLQVSTRTIWTYIQLKKLQASQVIRGGKVLVSASSIEKLLESGRHNVA